MINSLHFFHSFISLSHFFPVPISWFVNDAIIFYVFTALLKLRHRACDTQPQHEVRKSYNPSLCLKMCHVKSRIPNERLVTWREIRLKRFGGNTYPCTLILQISAVGLPFPPHSTEWLGCWRTGGGPAYQPAAQMERSLPKESSESEAQNESENVISVISIKNKSCVVACCRHPRYNVRAPLCRGRRLYYPPGSPGRVSLPLETGSSAASWDTGWKWASMKGEWFSFLPSNVQCILLDRQRRQRWWCFLLPVGVCCHQVLSISPESGKHRKIRKDVAPYCVSSSANYGWR